MDQFQRLERSPHPQDRNDCLMTQPMFDIKPDTLHRTIKMALDAGEVATIEEGYALFSQYRLGVAVGPEARGSGAHQAALLTIVNTARRAVLGGVKVCGNLNTPLIAPLPGGYATLAEAIEALGGEACEAIAPDIPLLALGSVTISERAGVTLTVSFDGWRGGVWPMGEAARLAESPTATLAAILAGALGVSEAFQHLRGNIMAGTRSCGLSLWKPEQADWRAPDGGLETYVAPTRLWLVGLGHLGQAYLWTLGLLPYADPGAVELTLQDFDRLTLANDSTSVLTQPQHTGRRKTREMGEWVESRGFSARLIERRFAGDVTLQEDDPRVLLCGVDNPEARATLEQAGFDLVVEAGLGGGPQEYLAMRIHSFPASVTAQAKWGGIDVEKEIATGKAYDDLAARGIDDCGLVELASRTVGAPFVGVVASTLVIAEVLRRLNGALGCEVVDLTLRDLSLRQIVPSTSPLRRFNPGFAHLDLSTPTNWLSETLPT